MEKHEIKNNKKNNDKLEYLNLELKNHKITIEKNWKMNKKRKKDEDYKTMKKLEYLNLELKNKKQQNKNYAENKRNLGKIQKWESSNYKENIQLIRLNNRKRKKVKITQQIVNEFDKEVHDIKINDLQHKSLLKTKLGYETKKI